MTDHEGTDPHDPTTRDGPGPISGPWINGTLPANYRVGLHTRITSELAFKRFRSRRGDAPVIGSHGTDASSFGRGARQRPDHAGGTRLLLPHRA